MPSDYGIDIDSITGDIRDMSEKVSRRRKRRQGMDSLREAMKSIDDFANELLAQKRDKQVRTENRQQQLSDEERQRQQGMQDYEGKLRLQGTLEEEKAGKQRASEEAEAQKWQPAKDEFITIYQKAQEAGDVALLRKAKALLVKIPDKYRDIKVTEIEQDVDNYIRRDREGREASALDSQRQRLMAAQDELLKAMDSGDEAAMDKAFHKVAALGASGDYAMYRLGLKGQSGGGGEYLSEEQKTKTGESLVGPLRTQSPQDYFAATGIPKEFDDPTATGLGIMPGDSTLSSLVPTGAGIERWATDYTRALADKLMEEASLWQAEGFDENSVHNISDPRVRGRISSEIQEQAQTKDTRPVMDQVLDPQEQLTDFERAFYAGEAAKAAIQAATEAGLYSPGPIPGTKGAVTNYVKSNSAKFVPQLRKMKLTLDDLLNALGGI